MAKFNLGIPVMSLTEAAAARLREISENADHPIAGLRVGVKNAGCAGMAYALDTIDKVDPADDVVEDKGVRVYVDPKAVLFLLGSVMDFRTSKMSSGFVFQNPNEVSACGCGESVNLKPAEIAPANA
ncbi:MAG: iron-sulfur cluster assembly accessory protein [Bauldia sp.]